MIDSIQMKLFDCALTHTVVDLPKRYYGDYDAKDSDNHKKHLPQLKPGTGDTHTHHTK